MAKNKVDVTLDLRVLNGILKNLDPNIADAIAKAAFAVEGRAKIKAPVDTGALRASIYTSLKGGVAQVQKFAGVEYGELPTPRDSHTAYVGPSVEYGQAIEFGSAGRAAQPYLLPAVRETEAEFRKLLGEAVTDGR